MRRVAAQAHCPLPARGGSAGAAEVGSRASGGLWEDSWRAAEVVGKERHEQFPRGLESNFLS